MYQDIVLAIEEDYKASAMHLFALKKSSYFEDYNVFETSIPINALSTIPDLIYNLSSLVGQPLTELRSFLRIHALVYDQLILLIKRSEDTKKEIDDYEVFNRELTITFYGHLDRVTELVQKLKKMYPVIHRTKVNWAFEKKQEIETISLEIKEKNIPKDSFYPWIRPNIDQFLQNYMDDEANLLLLLGPPGTGKTSLLRYFIFKYRMSVLVTHDETLMGMDDFFGEFIGGDNDSLILEDADILLRDRTDGNRVMNKLLNTSDGLIQTNKKIVMSANITHLDEIDPALIRPGRCFDVLMFRDLNHKEAVVAAQDAGVPEPDGNVTLSQLFQKRPIAKASNRIGF